MGNMKNDVANVLVLIVALLGVGSFSLASAADTPVLTLNSTRVCVGASWNLKVSKAAPKAAIRLKGIANDIPWEIPQWADTDASGNFSASGTYALAAAGKHSVVVEVVGATSNILPIEVLNCGWRNTTSLNTARVGHTATRLANGEVLVTGGPYSSGGNSAELYNPATETWSVTGKPHTARWD